MSGQTGPTEPDEKAAEGEANGDDREGIEHTAASDAVSSEAPAGAEAPPSESPKKGQAEAEAPPRGAYHVALPSFEGPLDLLLHLIQQHELDIKDIPILFVSKKYVEYIMLMQELNIDLASEYLVMAATLAHIKSKMLLPKPPIDQDDDLLDELDPRSELVRRLLEYQKYKDAAQNLGESSVLGRDVFLRGAPAPMVDGPAPLAQVGVFKLFDAFQRLLTRTKQKAEHLIDVDRISISERIIELSDLLRGRGRVPFFEIFGEDKTRADLIVSFLAVLEMTRLRMMEVTQDDSQAELFIELTLTEEHDEHLKKGPESDNPLAILAELAGERSASLVDGEEAVSESEASSSDGDDLEANAADENISSEHESSDLAPSEEPK